MSLELQTAEVQTLTKLWDTWSSSSDSELEATFMVQDMKTQRYGPLQYIHLLNVINGK